MIHVPTKFLPFSYQGYLFAESSESSFTELCSELEFRKILEASDLNKDIAWISINTKRIGEDFFNFISKYIAFPKGKAGYELSLKIADHPLLDHFKNEPVAIWNYLLRVPVSFTKDHLLKLSGSKLREILVLADEIWRRDQQLPSFPEANFETLRTELKKIRFPVTAQADETNRSRLKTLPSPWRAILSESGTEQTLELRAVIKDKVDLERAKTLFTKNLESLEKILEDLT